MRTILVLGSGAREHALAHRLACGDGQEPRADRRVIVCPGNAGIAREYPVLPAPEGGVEGYVELARKEGADLVVVGPEQPLVDGVVDALSAAGIKALGPTREAARLEGEKSYMKEALEEAGVSTARWGAFEDVASADAFLDTFGDAPAVVKADGLCAGKGVVVCKDTSEARAVVRDMLGAEGRAPRFGDASCRVVVESFLPGVELSVIALCDGERAVAFAPSRDHKRLLDGDQGPNTGGMGAVAPLGEAHGVSTSLLERVDEEVFRPVLARMRERGVPYRGFLYAGLMIDGEDVRVLELNVRFGDPEAQAVLYGTELDLLPLLDEVASGRGLPAELTFTSLVERCRPSVAVVCAAEGYPESPRKGAVIAGLDEALAVEGVKLFYAGVAGEGERLVANGGRVLSVTAVGSSVKEALERAYAGAERVSFAGKQQRSDIGQSVIGA